LAPCIVVRAPQGLEGEDVVVFVSYAARPLIRPHVRYHIDALHDLGMKVIVVLNVDERTSAGSLKLDCAAGIVIRANLGFDFGAWADAFRLLPALWSAKSVLLVNDSVYGPINGDLGPLFSRIRTSSADVIGLTESHEYALHLQSYFTVLKSNALRHAEVQRMWGLVRNLTKKWEVIRRYEVEMRARYAQCDLQCEAMFPIETDVRRPLNTAHYLWKDLAEAGFPYLKANLVRLMARREFAGWRDIIRDPKLVSLIEADLKTPR
jgi:lipopolysaccharide biosynthesis protein